MQPIDQNTATDPVTDPEMRDRLLERIGLAEPPQADAEGLRIAHRAFVSSVPYENLTVQLGESGALDPRELCERMLVGGRGGYCFEINTVLLTLLVSLGFEVERRESIVGSRNSHVQGEPTNHMALVARTPAGEEFIVEAGWGEGPLDPLPLARGKVTADPFSWELDREGEGWWVGQHEFGSTAGFHLADEAVELETYAPHHVRLSQTPDSSFVKTLLVQRPQADRIVTLHARTLTTRGPDIDEKRVMPDRDAFASALLDEFGIDAGALGEKRLGRLWSNAVLQHQECLREQAPGAEG